MRETNVSADGKRFEPVCWGQVGKGVHIRVGGDPIDNVVLSDRAARPRP